MLGVAMYITIKTLWEKGLNKSEIARMAGHDWKTVSKVIKKIESGEGWPEKKPHPRILDNCREDIVKMLEKGLNGKRIHEELTARGITTAAYSTVKDYVAEIRKRENIFVRIHTKPAEEAQVDFGYVGYTRDNTGKKRKTWVFNMRLSYSRLDYFKKVYDQRVETFIECHKDAFRYFGGVVECVRIDNLKAAVLKADFYEPVYQKLYQKFAEHYGFKIIPCRIYRPNDKAKVECGIKYVKRSFFAGRDFKDGDDVDRQLWQWQERICNTRIHGTTRKIPLEVFEKEEKSKLKPLPVEEFKMAKIGRRKVYHDCHIFVEYNYYSVPFEYVGKEVEIEIERHFVRIYYRGRQIAIHPRQFGRGEFYTDNSHYPKYKMYSETEYQEKYQTKMAEIGSYAEQLFFLTVQKHPRDWMRTVQGILSLLKTYPANVVNHSCKRAIAFNVCSYKIVKNICSSGSYILPLDFKFEEMRYEYIER